MYANRNHWSEQNTNQLISSLGGIAGQIINDKKNGVPVSGSANNVANLSQQTLAALGIASANPNADIKTTNFTPFIIGGVALVAIIVLIFALKK